jgi:hypothetical protein
MKSERPQRLQIVLWAIVLGLFVVVALKSYGSFQIGAYRDDAAYVVLARSFVESERYGMMSAPDEPMPAMFPFGYPLLLAPFAYFFPTQPEHMRWLSLFATAISGILLFWGWRTFSSSTSYWWGLAVTALFLFSPLTIGHTQMVMSEAVFTALVLGTILVAAQVRVEQFQWWQILVTSVLLVLMVFVRTIGITLVIAVFAFWLYHWRRHAIRPILQVVAGIVLVTGVIVALTVVEPADLLPTRYVQALNEDDDSLADQLYERPSRLRTLTNYLTRDIRNLVVPIGTPVARFFDQAGMPWLFQLYGLGITAVVALGAWVWFRREGVQLWLLFGLLYILALFGWTWSVSRLLYPIQPQIFFAFLLGLAFLAHTLTRRIPLKPRIQFAALALVVVLLVCVDIYQSTRTESSILHTGDLAERTAWVRTNIPADALVLTPEPHVDFLYGNRKTLRYYERAYDTTKRDVYILIVPRITWIAAQTPEYNRTVYATLLNLQNQARQGKVKLLFENPPRFTFVFQLTP